ncbi:hypothetical protein KHQ06_24660 [Nocardia tengchongensis]|uniref:Uncharacterized protein n=1 Tax=Nocardia tengchongensis TaxID=2055889 RepID=A0ABX8CL05_9NOCA|nr:hypothetical protein [Nocardia tengchongensis]QVI19553.1 hypothetical protein KHQ06_24660 [Nocardia tengchongensis]
MGVIAAFDGPLGAFHTGPVILPLVRAVTGRYPTRFAALTAVASTD